ELRPTTCPVRRFPKWVPRDELLLLLISLPRQLFRKLEPRRRNWNSAAPFEELSAGPEWPRDLPELPVCRLPLFRTAAANTPSCRASASRGRLRRLRRRTGHGLRSRLEPACAARHRGGCSQCESVRLRQP